MESLPINLRWLGVGIFLLYESTYPTGLKKSLLSDNLSQSCSNMSAAVSFMRRLTVLSQSGIFEFLLQHFHQAYSVLFPDSMGQLNSL